jgi:hypothetical protein
VNRHLVALEVRLSVSLGRVPGNFENDRFRHFSWSVSLNVAVLV